MIKIIQYVYNYIAFTIWLVRVWFWRLFLQSIGEKTTFMKNIYFYSPSWIKIWKRCFINMNCIIDGKGWVEIWDDVSLGPNVRIWSFNHNTDSIDTPMNIQGNKFAKVIIRDDVWVWDGSILLPWVTIWRWVIIGAWSVVTRDIEEYSVAAGNPAKIIKKRN